MNFHIQVYTCFKSSSHVYIKGRILKDGPILSKPSHGILTSLFYTLLRALSREIPYVDMDIIIGTAAYKTVTDREGYFEVFENIEATPLQANRISIIAKNGNDTSQAEAALDDMSKETGTGIISDIDDTILVTGVKSFFKLRLIFNTLFLNPFRRKPIESAAEAFDKLSKNGCDESGGPIIYLSNSPWNIYDYLQTFLEHNEFPNGIIMLRDMGLQLLRSRAIQDYNKFLEIEKMLICFNDTKFIMVGDTGEKDFDIYKAIFQKHPDRISRVILNTVKNRKKIAEIKAYNAKQEGPQVELVEGYVGVE